MVFPVRRSVEGIGAAASARLVSVKGYGEGDCGLYDMGGDVFEVVYCLFKDCLSVFIYNSFRFGLFF